jgi:hypothetical protein
VIGNQRDRLGHDAPDLGDLILVLLASTLSGLRDRLAQDGFMNASDLVADLVDELDGYITAFGA